MNRQKRQLGGFVALNTGLITNCYSKVDLHQTEHLSSSGFCDENRGTLERCAAQGRVHGKGQKGGFCRQQKGRHTHNMWLRPRRAAEEDWLDWEHSMAEEAVSEADLEGWKLGEIWHLHTGSEGAAKLSLHDRPEELGEYDHVVEIGDARGLLEFAGQVNSGTADPSTRYLLTADIDLKGKSWAPVGPDANAPFQGCFDGGGHQIHNFVVHASKHPFAGFFGCVGSRGSVHNLRIDCQMLGKGNAAAPLCAVNDGEIANCTVSFHAEPSRYTGGLVAQNNGTVKRSSALGKIRRRTTAPWWLTALLLLLLCIPAPIYFSLTAQAAGQEIFAPVIMDPNAQPIDPETEITPAPDEVTDTSASFIMNAEMHVGTENYAGSIGLRCPTWSTRGFVATVRLTVEDQEKIGYSGNGEAVSLYQSGLIAPGYGVDVITLSALPDGSRLPAGEYELSVLLEFYDIETNEKSAVNTVVPLEVTVG